MRRRIDRSGWFAAAMAIIACLLLAAGRAAEPDKPKLEPYTEEIEDTLVAFDLVPVPGGSLELADPRQEGQRVTVELKPFWIGKYELRWDEYDTYMLRLDLDEAQIVAGVDADSRPSLPYGAPDRGFGHQGFAAISLTYQAGQAFCAWLSRKTGKTYRLPTEAEWEYACRAGGPGGKLDAAQLGQVAWYWDNSDDTTHAVGKKQPNAWGLYDLLGNAGEWCDGLDGKPVLCGGSFQDEAADVWPGARQHQTPRWNQRDPQEPKSKWWLSDGPHCGFRVVRPVD